MKPLPALSVVFVVAATAMMECWIQRGYRVFSYRWVCSAWNPKPSSLGFVGIRNQHPRLKDVYSFSGHRWKASESYHRPGKQFLSQVCENHDNNDVVSSQPSQPSMEASFRLKNFSEFATHVELIGIPKDCQTTTTITVENAILQSMRAYESSLAKDNEDCDQPPRIILADKNPTAFATNALKRELQAQINMKLKDHPQNTPLTPRQLLHLGSIWYLSAEDYRKNQELEQEQYPNETETETSTDRNARKIHNRIKPIRLSLSNATMHLHYGDYLRIHHSPRRFRRVYQADWSLSGRTDRNATGTEEIDFDKVVQQQGPGYVIIDKPPLIPVHPTIDNSVENVAHQLLVSLQDQQGLTDPLAHHDASELSEPYLVPVQRIDVNTSGLLVLATSPEFAAYFSQLLRLKTAAIASQTSHNGTLSSPSIQKGYKCLVCIQPNEEESVLEAWERLSRLQKPKIADGPNTNDDPFPYAIKHYLKASDRAPKYFVEEIPEDTKDEKWYECLLEITHVGPPIPLFGSQETSDSLSDRLWPRERNGNNNRMPTNTKAVVEVEVSLITGRTHQIRGQMSRLGFPIVGDEQYGGARSLPQPSESSISESNDDQLLALQCCHIRFPDADYESVFHKKKRRDVLKGFPNRSGRWVEASISRAWWTSHMEEEQATFSGIGDIDFGNDIASGVEASVSESLDSVTLDNNDTMTVSPSIRRDLLPPLVQLSPGSNKYVIAKLRDPETQTTLWFVQSAPLPYHADVASELLEWIASVPGFEMVRVTVTGGGRIAYDPLSSTAKVYGFSYRYGKGDHIRAASLIQESDPSLSVNYDLSDQLY